MAKSTSESRNHSTRTVSRLERHLNVPRAISLFTVPLALMCILLFVVFSDNAGARLVVTISGIAVFAIGMRTLQNGSGFLLVAQVILCIPPFVLVAVHPSVLPASSGATLIHFAIWCTAVCGAAVLSIATFRILSPLKSFVLGASTAIACIVAASVFEMSQTPVESKVAVSAPARMKWDTSVLAPNLVVWAGNPGLELPDGLEYVYRPNIVFKNYYPSNPRDYFDQEEVYAPLDVRLGNIGKNGAEGTVEFPATSDGTVRLKPLKITPGQSWRLRLSYGDLPLMQGVRYQLRFQARADADRELVVQIVAGNDSANKELHIKVPLTSTFSNFSFFFDARHSTSDSILDFEFGQAQVPLELRALQLRPIPTELAVDEDPKIWSDGAEGTAQGEWNVGRSAPIRWPDESLQGKASVPLQRKLGEIREGSKYEVYLRARADAVRPVRLELQAANTPEVSMEFGAELELNPEWNYFAWEFIATASASNPRLIFNPLDSEVPFEIGDCRVWPESGVPLPDQPKRYVVSYQINSKGYRDREYEERAAPHVYRIACLGDSFTFGQGVHELDTFVRRLETVLTEQRESQGPRFEVMNFGVSGYCTRQERLCFEQAASQFHPDLVLVTMVPNDNVSYREEVKLGIGVVPKNEPQLIGRIKQQLRTTHESLGYEVCATELLALDKACRSQRAKLAVVIFQNGEHSDWEAMSRAVEQGLANTGVPILNLKPYLAHLPFHVQFVHAVDLHPSEIAHDIASREIARFLKRENLLTPVP